MGDFGEALEWFAADLLSRRIGGDQVRVFRLEEFEFAVERVVFSVRDFGGGLVVVEVVVVSELLAESEDA